MCRGPHLLTLGLEERVLARIAMWPLTSPDLMTLEWKAVLIEEGEEPLLASWSPVHTFHIKVCFCKGKE